MVRLFVLLLMCVAGLQTQVLSQPSIEIAAATASTTYSYDSGSQLSTGAHLESITAAPTNRDRRPSATMSGDSPRAMGHCVAAEAGAGAARSTNFIVHPNGDVVPVPNGAVGPTAVDSGKGFQFTGGSGGHGLDPRTTDVRIMDPVTTGKNQYPDGYVSYSNGSGQAVNPYTGQTVGKADPWWHWPF